MSFGPRLAGARVLLRAPVESDLHARQLLGRDAEIARMFGAAHPMSGPMSSEAAAAWFAKLGEGGTVEWVVEAEGAFLGTARLHSFRSDQSARYAVGFFDPDRLGKGFGSEVTTIVVGYAFGSLGLKRVDLLATLTPYEVSGLILAVTSRPRAHTLSWRPRMSPEGPQEQPTGATRVESKEVVYDDHHINLCS